IHAGDHELDDNVAFADLRDVGSLLGRADGGLLAYALGMTTWQRRERFCGAGGALTIAAEGGRVRKCSANECGELDFPRTDPAVIMLVTAGDGALLGRQAMWPRGLYSTLAGFVEPGESLEEAVAREVREETTIVVTDVHYHSSQPWPFPSSLMLGFEAVAGHAEAEADADELEAPRWFTRFELHEAIAAGDVSLPRPVSIARRLVDGWLDR